MENDLQKNIEKVKAVLAETKKMKLDFLCFPETYLSGYTPEAIMHSAVSLDDPEIRALVEYCGEFDTVVLVGMSEKKN